MTRFGVLLLLLLISNVYCCSDAAKYAKPTCGGSSSSQRTQLLAPANPPRECIYHIKASSKHVTQLRIDFAWTLANPSLPTAASGNNLTYVECVNDYFQVGSIRLCGVETKQHIYVPLNRTAGVSTMDLSLVLANRAAGIDLPIPAWDIKVTQLEEDGFFVAPPGCLQYFPQASGVVTTFNYNRALGIYLGNMEYAICFRRQVNTQALVLKALVFDIGSKKSSNKLLELDENCYSHQRSVDESEDYLMIPDATAEKLNVRATYYCGNSIEGDTVRSTNPGPLMLLFNSDTHYNNQPVAGFYLTYKIL